MRIASNALVVDTSDQRLVARLLDAAARGTVALVPLPEPPPTGVAHPIELRSAVLGASLLLVGVSTGPGETGGYPMRLRARSPKQGPALEELAGRLRQGAAAGDSGAEAALGRADTHPASEPPQVDRQSAHGLDPLVGRVVGGGRYRIEEVLGTGGMGRVYRGWHTQLERPVAVKVLRSALRSKPKVAERFHREALAASRLDHPNVMRVVDFGTEPDGLLYIVMELLEGRDVAQIAATAMDLPAGEALDIVAQAARGLAAAHEAGIIHRDMKPQNIIVVSKRDADGAPVHVAKVCDFGLARLEGMDTLQPGQRALGTPSYMSPEQCRGDVTDARTDIYACGVILFELLTGAVPFTADDPLEVLRMQVLEPPPAPSTFNPKITAEVDRIVLRALEKSPDARYGSARELRDALLAARNGLLGAA